MSTKFGTQQTNAGNIETQEIFRTFKLSEHWSRKKQLAVRQRKKSNVYEIKNENTLRD